jgi:hypothetical protein
MKSESLAIPADIAAKCDGPDQAERFDLGIRAFLAVPKSAVLKSEARAKRRKKKANRPV